MRICRPTDNGLEIIHLSVQRILTITFTLLYVQKINVCSRCSCQLSRFDFTIYRTYYLRVPSVEDFGECGHAPSLGNFRLYYKNEVHFWHNFE